MFYSTHEDSVQVKKNFAACKGGKNSSIGNTED